MKETNLEKIKEQAILFLYLEPVRDKKYGFIVHHPFFQYSAAYDEISQSMFDIFEDNEKYNNKVKKIKNKILSVNSVEDILLLMSKPYQLTFFKFINQYLSKDDFSKILISIWIKIEMPQYDENVSLKKVIKWFKKADRETMMTERDIELFNNLPEKITIYRGVCNKKDKNGISWTTNKNVATWFAKRFQKTPFIYETKINKEDILAYTNSRNENEAIIDIFKLEKEKIKEIKL